MSSAMEPEGEEKEEYLGLRSATWDTAFLSRLAALLAKHNILLKPPDGTHSFSKRKRRAALVVARALAPPLLTASQVYQTVDRFTEIYLDKGASGAGQSRAPAWMRAVEPHLRHAACPAPDPAERVLRALTERARALRSADPAAVCCALPAAPHASAAHLQQVWARMLAGARAKLDALIAGGDSEAGLQAGARLSRAEWRLVDALLLHDDSGTLRVVREEHARRTEPLRALVAVFHLVQLYRLEEPGGVSRGRWRAAAASYRRRGRLASAVLLQRRWHDLKLQTRWRVTRAARGAQRGAGYVAPPAPLHLAVARRFPQVVVAPLPAWRDLVAARALVEECDLTQEVSGPDELPDVGTVEEWGEIEEPPLAPTEAEDDLILVEREIETVDLLAADEDDDSGEQMEAGRGGTVVVKQEAAEDVREMLRERRRQVALALERELDRQLRDLDGGTSSHNPPSVPSPLIVYDSDEDTAAVTKHEDDSGDEETPARTRGEDGTHDQGEGDEPTIDPKLLMSTSVPVMRVDAAGWRDLLPPTAPARPLRHDITIVSIKSEECKRKEEECKGGEEECKRGEEEGNRRGRIRLPDIAEVRRINSGMKTAQVAPLVPPADRPAADVSSRRSSGEGALWIEESGAASEEEHEGGALTAAELRAVLRAHWEGEDSVAGTRWRELYCCAARYHRALNDARRRCAVRGGRAPPPDAPVHAARCASTQKYSVGGENNKQLMLLLSKCGCCCVHLLDAEGAARALTADHERLLDDVRAILAGTYAPGEAPDTAPNTADNAGRDEPDAEPAPPPAKKARKKKKKRNPRRCKEPAIEPATDPLQEWIRQKNITSRFFDLNLKKPEKPPKPPEPPAPPSPLTPEPPEPASPPSQPASPPSQPTVTFSTTPVMTVSKGKIVKKRIVNKVKVTVKTGAGTSSRSLLLRSIGGEVGGNRTAPAGERTAAQPTPQGTPIAEYLQRQARRRERGGSGGAGGLPANAIPVTMQQTRGGMRLMSVVTPAPAAPPGEVIDLCDEEPSPSPSPPISLSPSPPRTPPTPPSTALLKSLPPEISVRRREVRSPDSGAQQILCTLPPGILVKRHGRPPAAGGEPSPSTVVLNGSMPPAPCLQVSPMKKGNSNIKVFKISEDGLLTPTKAQARPPRPLPPPPSPASNTKIVLIPRKATPGGAPVRAALPPRLLNSLLAARSGAPGTRLKVAELRTTNGKRVLVMRPPTEERRAAPAPATLNMMEVVPLAPASPAPAAPSTVSTVPKLTFNNLAMSYPVISPIVSMPTVFAPVASTGAHFTCAGSTSTMFTSIAPAPTILTPVSMPLITTPLMTAGTLVSASTILKAPTGSDATRVPPARKMAIAVLPPAKEKLDKIPKKKIPWEYITAAGDVKTTCKFEMTSEAIEPETRAEIKAKEASRDAPSNERAAPSEGGAVVTLQGGATVRPAEPSHDFSDLTITVEEWNARGGAPIVQVMERGVAPYWAGGYYVRTSRPLPLTRAAIWTPGPVSCCARLVLPQAPSVRSNERAHYLRLAAGVIVRAEWVCRSAEDVAREARAGARLHVVHANTGHAHPVYSVRPPRPGLLALRCKFLTAAQQITQDVNQHSHSEGHLQTLVRIAPRPAPTAPRPAPSGPCLAPAGPRLAPRVPFRVSAGPRPVPADPRPTPADPRPAPATPRPAAIHTSSGGQSLLKPLKRPATPPARPPQPPEPARRSSRRAAHDARAKLNDLMKQGSKEEETRAGGGEGAGEEEGLDYSTAAGVEAADSDEDYNAADDLRRERSAGRRARGRRHTAHAPVEGEGEERREQRVDPDSERELHVEEVDMELDDNTTVGGIIPGV